MNLITFFKNGTSLGSTVGNLMVLLMVARSQIPVALNVESSLSFNFDVIDAYYLITKPYYFPSPVLGPFIRYIIFSNIRIIGSINILFNRCYYS